MGLWRLKRVGKQVTSDRRKCRLRKYENQSSISGKRVFGADADWLREQPAEREFTKRESIGQYLHER